MNMRNSDIPLILNGKCMTGRNVDFKIVRDKVHKFISDRRYGAFGEAYVYGWFICEIGELSKHDLKMLGYESAEEYLSEPFNQGLTLKSKKKFIQWCNFKPNWDVLDKINWK